MAPIELRRDSEGNYTFNQPVQYRALAFEGIACDPDFGDPLDLGGGVWAIHGFLCDADEFWRGAIGSLRADSLDRANFSIVAALPEETPLSEETLKTRVLTVFYAMVLGGVPSYRGAHMPKGKGGSSITIDAFGQLPSYLYTRESPEVVITRERIAATGRIARRLREVYDAPLPVYRRFRCGYNAFLQGLREYEPYERLHQLVRSLDGLAKTRIRRGEVDFVERIQHIVGRSHENAAMLSHLYRLRNATEHLNSFASVLDPATAEEVGLQRTYQAEVIAAHSYRRIFETPELLAAYESDDTIDAFWAQDLDALVDAWSPQLDLEAEIQARHSAQGYVRRIGA